MEKMIQALFNNEVEAFTGLQALQQLDQNNDISLGETYVLSKDLDGNTSLRSAKDKAEGTGVVSGGLVGGLIGLIAGPLGFLVGVAGGMFAGSASETLRAEEVSDYLDKVSANIPLGKSVLIAHLWEDWETPVDTALATTSIGVQRFNIYDEVFVPAHSELSKTNNAIKEAEKRHQIAEGAEKEDWEATLTQLKSQRENLQLSLDKNVDKQAQQYQEWINHIQPKVSSETSDEQQAKLKNRMEEQKARLEQIKRNR
jgi:uncharacterized membrane protein